MTAPNPARRPSLAIRRFVIVLASALYSIAAYVVFAWWFSSSIKGSSGGLDSSGLMLLTFLVGIPLTTGLFAGFLAARWRAGGADTAVWLTLGAIASLIVGSMLFLGEGSICVVIGLPLLLVPALVGACLGYFLGFGLGDRLKARDAKVMSFGLFVPMLLAPIEQRALPETSRLTIRESIVIAAPPEVVWHHINHPLDIRPRELSGAFAYRIGVPYPIEARTIEGRVGGQRQLQWQRGVRFEETITAWQPNVHIAWTYQFRPDSFPAGSLDDHIVIGGRYFDLETTGYMLTPEAGGTRLTIDVGSRVSTNFSWYAAPWASYLIGDTARAILRFYKARSEDMNVSTRIFGP